MVEIARFHDPVRAGLAKARLAAAGIEAILLDHNSSAVFGGALMPSRLVVLQEDETRAREVLKD